jgi:sulfur-carrier protein
MSISVQVDYYAAFREQRGCASETVQTAAKTALELYGELQARHGFRWPAGNLQVAVNDEFRDWGEALNAGDRVVFIAPVSGG